MIGSFIAFPRTPHLGGSAGSGDDDAVVDALPRLGDGQLFVVEEKLDGANVSVHFASEATRWQPVLQKRSGLIEAGERFAQFDVFRDFVFERLETLWELLRDRYVLFGEFLFATHAVAYDRLPDLLLAFDVFDKQTQRFLARERVEAMLSGSGLHQVPLLQRGGELTRERLLELSEQTSLFGGEKREGVYVRIEADGFVVDRYKFRRHNFVPGAAEFGRDHRGRNQIASSSSSEADSSEA